MTNININDKRDGDTARNKNIGTTVLSPMEKDNDGKLGDAMQIQGISPAPLQEKDSGNTSNTPSPLNFITPNTKSQTDTNNSSSNSTLVTAATGKTHRVDKKNGDKKKRKKKKKNLCYMADCTQLASKFVGDCNFCNGHYCSKHRLMESHECKGLDGCKEEMHKRNAEKLDKEQTLLPKIQI